MSIWSVSVKARRGRGRIAAQKGRIRVVSQAFKRASWKGASVRETCSALYRSLAQLMERDGRRRFWRDFLPHQKYGEVRHGRGA